jgi:AcrR family transcriptional regulator
MPLRTPQQVRSYITVGRILHSATALIRQNGCAGLTVSDIARVAGIPSGSIYQYFPDRSAIIGQLAEQYRAKNQRTVSQSLAAMKTVVAGICETLRETYRELHQEHPIARDIVMGMTMDVQLRAMGTQYVQEHVEFVFDRVKHLFDNGQYEPVKQVILLSMHCSAVAVEMVKTLDNDQRQVALELARTMLRTSWNSTIGRCACVD